MPFNSNSYYRNAWRRQALEELTEARQRKAELEREAAEELPSLTTFALGADYQAGRIAMAVRSARSSWRLYLSQRRICELSSRAAPYVPEPFSTRLKESNNA